MILAKKYKATISIITAIWLVLFIGISTSHMGNAHNLYFSRGDVSQNISGQAEQTSHSHCPWAHAATMTTGSPVLHIDFSESIAENLFLSDIQSQCPTILASIHNPRGPPVS